MSLWGHSPHFDRGPTPSGPPPINGQNPICDQPAGALRWGRPLIDADPYYAVHIRHDGGNNVIVSVEPKSRIRPDSDRRATRMLQSLAQLGVGFARFPMDPRFFAVCSTRSSPTQGTPSHRNNTQATGDEAFVHQPSQWKLRLSERDNGSAWRQLSYPVRQGSERRKEREVLVSRGGRVVSSGPTKPLFF